MSPGIPHIGYTYLIRWLSMKKNMSASIRLGGRDGNNSLTHSLTLVFTKLTNICTLTGSSCGTFGEIFFLIMLLSRLTYIKPSLLRPGLAS